MTKLKLTAALALLLALLGAPVAAHAVPHGFVAESEDDTESAETEDGEDSQDVEDTPDFEDSGDHDKDFDDSFVVPPVFVHPQRHDRLPLDVQRGSDGKPAPFENHPIEVNKVEPTAKTPTDVFVSTATVGLGAVGAGAVGLGAVVGVRAIRAKRAGTKNDYLYGE